MALIDRQVSQNGLKEYYHQRSFFLAAYKILVTQVKSKETFKNKKYHQTDKILHSSAKIEKNKYKDLLIPNSDNIM